MRKQIVCKVCGGPHYGTFCYRNAKNRLKPYLRSKAKKEVTLPKCKKCSKLGHWSYMCPLIKRKSIRKESVKARAKRIELNNEWLRLNPSDNKGRWFCYLNISTDCPKVLTAFTLQLEHVRSRARHPGLKWDINNLKPACGACNALKKSLDIEDLVDEFPHLKILLDA